MLYIIFYILLYTIHTHKSSDCALRPYFQPPVLPYSDGFWCQDTRQVMTQVRRRWLWWNTFVCGHAHVRLGFVSCLMLSISGFPLSLSLSCVFWPPPSPFSKTKLILHVPIHTPTVTIALLYLHA